MESLLKSSPERRVAQKQSVLLREGMPIASDADEKTLTSYELC
jgi:hypothetical protein